MFAFMLFVAAAQLPIPPGAVVTVRPSISPVTVLPPHSLPPGAMSPRTIVREPQETIPLTRYFSEDDYPSGAPPHGIVGFTLTIGPDGRVIGCNITQSSGSSILDVATCNIMRRRARYTPAMDSNGSPAVGTIEQEIEWKAPAR